MKWPLHTDDRQGVGIELAWREALQELRAAFPQARIEGRIRTDVDNVAVKARSPRDAAGLRIIGADKVAVRSYIAVVKASWPVIEERDYMAGHPRTPCYRAHHVFCLIHGYEMEVQIRTRRQHVLAEWTHGRLLQPLQPPWDRLSENPSVVVFLRKASDWCDARDDNQEAGAFPTPPAQLRALFDLRIDDFI